MSGAEEPHILAAEAVAAAEQERARLASDGPAPPVESILLAMGRKPTGEEYPPGHKNHVSRWVPASEAGRRALGHGTTETGP